MTLRLTVDAAPWRRHVGEFAASIDGIVPVTKGNGYGFGLAPLAAHAAGLAETVAVGTLHEAQRVAEIAAVRRILVLTPVVTPGVLPPNALPTVAGSSHVSALATMGWTGAVAVKLESSMRRFGVDATRLDALCTETRRAGFTVDSFVLHLPLLTGDAAMAEAVAEVEGWLSRLDPQLPLSVSHLSPSAFRTLQRRHPGRRILLRAGTALWHGDKSFLRLQADVVDVRPVSALTRVGYRLGEVAGAGTVAMIGAGTAHGVAPLPDGRSPFHHARRRLALVEPPHMHTSMAFVADGEPCPCVGSWVDVQRPLTATWVDEVVWT